DSQFHGIRARDSSGTGGIRQRWRIDHLPGRQRGPSLLDRGLGGAGGRGNPFLPYRLLSEREGEGHLYPRVRGLDQGKGGASARPQGPLEISFGSARAAELQSESKSFA